VEPTATPPWRSLDGAAASGSAPAAEPGGDRSSQAPLSPTVLKVGATVVGAVACAVLAFILAFADGPGDALVLEGGSALPIPGASGAVDPAEASTGPVGSEVVVEIVGAVPRPGVFRLSAGSRVGDLVAAAGGYGPRVDTARAERELNLAATLHDGDQVRVPSRDDAPTGGGAGADGGTAPTDTPAGTPVDLNQATQAELEALPGIGPATAQKIIAAREEAPFAAVEELRTRGVLGEKTFEKLRELVAVR
jgi:competence protein ComEA